MTDPVLPVLSQEDTDRRAERKRKVEAMYKWADEGRLVCLVRFIVVDLDKIDWTYDIPVPSHLKDQLNDKIVDRTLGEWEDVQRWLLTNSCVALAENHDAEMVKKLSPGDAAKLFDEQFRPSRFPNIHNRAGMMQFDALYLFNE